MVIFHTKIYNPKFIYFLFIPFFFAKKEASESNRYYRLYSGISQTHAKAHISKGFNIFVLKN